MHAQARLSRTRRTRTGLLRAVSVVTTLLALFAGSLLTGGAPASAVAAATKPVINGPVFNDPFGTADQQKAIFTQLVQLIDATPAEQTITASMFEFADSEVADALLAAHTRGVNVKLIVDDSTYVDGDGNEFDNPAFDSLQAGLGTDDSKSSYIVVCDDQFEDNDGVDDVARGCLAVGPPNPAYNHNKFFLFSKIGPFDDGTSYSKVVFQTSSNLSNWYKVESFNDAVTFVDGTVYDGYAKYHEMMRTTRYKAAGNNNAYFSTPTGSTYRAFFFPRGDSSYNNPGSDTIVNALKEISCAYTGTDGKRHQTDIRIVVLNFLKSRIQVANQLATLRAAGCWIDILYASSDSTVESVLTNADIQHRKCMIPNGPGIDVRPHNKEMLIDGDYNGSITPRVYTGSPNLDGSSLRSSDEAMVRITDAGYHAKYLSTFYKIRTACGG